MEPGDELFVLEFKADEGFVLLLEADALPEADCKPVEVGLKLIVGVSGTLTGVPTKVPVVLSVTSALLLLVED
jgi:hypothetical protein